MFDIGFWELIVLGAVALIIVGPEQMPGLIKTVMSYLRHFQRQFRSIREDVERELNVDALQAEQKSLHDLLNNNIQTIDNEFNDIKAEYQATYDEVVEIDNIEDGLWDNPDRFDDSEHSLPDPDEHADTGVDQVDANETEELNNEVLPVSSKKHHD